MPDAAARSAAVSPTARLAMATGQMSVGRVVAAVQRAEDLGCEAAFVGEAPTEADAFVTAAAALLATSRIRVGPGVVNAHERHPAALARGAATLDRLAPGRVILGIGRGDVRQVSALRLQPARSLDALRDALLIARALLRSEAAAHDGVRWSAHTGPLAARALPRAPVPIALAAVGERALELAGTLADAVLLNYGASPDYVRWAVARVAAGATAAGRDPGSVDVYGWVLLARTDLEGAAGEVDAVRRTLEDLFASGEQARALARHGGGSPARWDAAALRRFAVVGTGEECHARLDEYRHAGLRCPVLLPSGLRSLTAGAASEALLD